MIISVCVAEEKKGMGGRIGRVSLLRDGLGKFEQFFF